MGKVVKCFVMLYIVNTCMIYKGKREFESCRQRWNNRERERKGEMREGEYKTWTERCKNMIKEREKIEKENHRQ